MDKTLGVASERAGSKQTNSCEKTRKFLNVCWFEWQ